jgi:hypothetical protein
LIAERISAYEAIGVDLILCAFLHFTDELPAFGREVIPLLRGKKIESPAPKIQRPVQKSSPDAEQENVATENQLIKKVGLCHRSP